jgi:hypothetical protein
MTAPDRMPEAFENSLHDAGHPHMEPPANPEQFMSGKKVRSRSPKWRFRNTCLRKRPSVQNEARRRNLVNIDHSIGFGFPFLRRRLMGMLTLFESRQLA